MAFVEIPFSPGVFADDSSRTAKSHFTRSNNIRFVQVGENIMPQVRGGYEKFSTSSLVGYGRGIHTWADRSKNPYMQVGTEYRLYSGDLNGVMIDSTPVISYGTLTNPFSTSAASSTIFVSHTSHGLSTGQLAQWPYLAVSINNATITTTTRYPITVIDANSYTFVADTSATSNGAATTGEVDYRYGLAPGMTDGVYGSGYGTGGYGSGSFGGSSSVVVYPRTWSFAEWGANSVSNPRGGPIFEWAPNSAESEIVTNAYFTALTGWTFAGTSWSMTGAGIHASTSSANLTQTQTALVAAWHNVHLVVSVNAGSFVVSMNGATLGTISANGHYNYQFYGGAGGAQTFQIAPTSYTGDIRQINATALTTAYQIPSAPNPTTCIMSTAERALVACGINDSNGNFDPMKVAWTDRGLNQVWTANVNTNLAGANSLSNGSRIVACKRGSGENLIWTDKALYAMRANPDPSVVYDFVEVGQNCGCIGANGAVVVNGIAFWMTPSGAFKMYGGGPPVDLNCTVRQDFFNNLAWVQQDKIFAHSISGWSEVEWFYPDSRDGFEVSRYIKFNFATNSWDSGLRTTTCWADAGIYQYPISMSTNGFLYFEEKGNTADGAPLTWSIRGPALQISDGEQWIKIGGMRPDAKSVQGGYSVTLYATWGDIRGLYTRTFGPYMVTSMTGTVAMRAKAKNIEIEWSGSSAPAAWRMGRDEFDISGADMR